jgi:hypothetical protein
MSSIEFPKLETGVTAISSCSSGQKSKIIQEEKRSVFTKSFIDGMQGGADKDKNRKIGLNELYDYLEMEVPKITDQFYPGHEQNPNKISGELGNLTIFQY